MSKMIIVLITIVRKKSFPPHTSLHNMNKGGQGGWTQSPRRAIGLPALWLTACCQEWGVWGQSPHNNAVGTGY